jgi:hypothetical protein
MAVGLPAFLLLHVVHGNHPLLIDASLSAIFAYTI